MWNWGKAGASGYSVAKCSVFCPNLSPNVAARALALWLKDWAPDISFITWRKSQHWKRKKYSFILQIQVDLSFYVQNNMMSHHRWAWLKCAQRFLSQIASFFEKCTALSKCHHLAQKSLGSNTNQPAIPSSKLYSFENSTVLANCKHLAQKWPHPLGQKPTIITLDEPKAWNLHKLNFLLINHRKKLKCYFCP